MQSSPGNMDKNGLGSQAYVLNELAKFGFTILASFQIPDCSIPIQPPWFFEITAMRTGS